MKQLFFLAQALLFCSFLQAQKLMELPPALDSVSPMQVKQRSGIAFMRYEFGPYRLIQGKGGWAKTTEEREGGFLSFFLSNVRDVVSNTREKRSFKLINQTGDTAVVNMVVTTVLQFEQYKKGLIGNQYESERFQGAYANWIASVDTKDTSQHWILTAFKAEKAGIIFDKTTPLQATLRNGDRELQVVPVQQYGTGKKAWDPVGFVVSDKGVPLAAMQFRGDNPLKNHVQSFIWIAPDNDAQMQLMLATALTALLSIAHETYYGSLQDAGPPR